MVFTLVQCQDYSSLEIIDLRGKKIKSLPGSILKNTKARELHIGTGGFKVYPPMSVIPDQKIPLRKIPQEISGMKELRRLTISSARISSLPESISTLQKLHYLDLSFNDELNIQEQMAKIGRMEALDTLVVYGRLLNGKIKSELRTLNPELKIIDEESLAKTMIESNAN